jgi:hypothetical protein
MDEIEVDTVIVVQSDGSDFEFNTKQCPGMGAYLVPGLSEDSCTLWITIPLKRGHDTT